MTARGMQLCEAGTADRWRAVHLAGDRAKPFTRHEPLRPFWIDEATVRKLLAKRRGG